MKGSPIAALAAAVLLLSGIAPAQERQPDRPSITTIQLRNAYADEIAKILTARLGGERDVQITWDGRTNRILLRGNDETVRQAKRILDRLDRPPRKSGVYIFQLKHANAVQAAVLMNVFLKVVPYPGAHGRIRVTPDGRTNSLLICGMTEEEAELLEAILSRIDD
jgi:type II secretory pathway component GspD/PulD (secretin)